MPKVEDFPPIAQKAIKAQDGDAPAPGIETQKKKVGFFERLTGRRNSSESKPEIVRDKEPSMTGPKDKGAEAAAEPANRHKAAGELPSRAQLGRTAGQPKPSRSQQVSHEDGGDLEIPAFLKRQAN
jgi:cell division protein FtsZ